MRDAFRIVDGGYNRHLDFPTFIKVYARIFHGDAGSENEDTTDTSDSRSRRNFSDARGRARVRANGDRDLQPPFEKRLGFGVYGSNMTERRRRDGEQTRERMNEDGHDRHAGIGEEAELHRWKKRLGERQMHQLEQVFNRWADEGRGDEAGARGIEVRDLKDCFRELGRDVQPFELRAWCSEADLAPGDILSLADFAYAFHVMFVDAKDGGAWRP